MRCPVNAYHKYIGVDGCRAGWFYVSINRYGEFDSGVFKTLPELWQAHKRDSLILVDIPIGLPSSNNLGTSGVGPRYNRIHSGSAQKIPLF
jgi:predicted RNase H-like nuclease